MVEEKKDYFSDKKGGREEKKVETDKKEGRDR